MRWRGLLILALGIVGLVALANAARHTLVRQPLLQGTSIKLAQSYTLAENAPDDLVIVAQDIDLPANRQVKGDVALIGKHVSVDASVTGDLTVMASQVVIGPEAQIGGDAVLLVEEAQVAGQIDGTLNLRGDTLTIDPSAQIESTVYACADTLVDHREAAPLARPCEEGEWLSSSRKLEALRDPNVVLPLVNITVSGAAVLVMLSALGSLALAGVSVLGVVLFPRQISHIEEALRRSPRQVGSTGVMLALLAAGVSFAVALGVVVVPLLGLVLVPVYVVATLGFLGMALAGWITVTLVAGDLILRRVTMVALPPLVIAAVGNITLLLIWNLLALNPFSRIVGMVAFAALCVVGLGAACVTRLGTRAMHRSYLVQG